MKVHPLTEETLDLELELCLRCHPSGFSPRGSMVDEGRRLKKELFREIFERVRPAGFVAGEEGSPVSLLEMMPREYARRSGYIIGDHGEDDETLTIVCLEVAYGYDRKEMMRAMVSHLTRNLELFRPFRRIEVGAFPRDVDFHPAWVYQEAGFLIAEDRDEALVLTIQIPE
jgi:hypothetical protein